MDDSWLAGWRTLEPNWMLGYPSFGVDILIFANLFSAILVEAWTSTDTYIA